MIVLRSDFIRHLTLLQLERDRALPTSAPSGHSDAIPRTLVRYWHDPHGVPPDVRECLDSWEPLRGEGFSMRMFDDASARAYMAERYGPREVAAFERCRHPAMRSDYLRMGFVLAEGGLYVDADDVLVGDGWSDVFRDAQAEGAATVLRRHLRRHGGGGGTAAGRPADGGPDLLREQQPDRRPRRAPCPAGGRWIARQRRSWETIRHPRSSRPPALETSRRPWPRTCTRR